MLSLSLRNKLCWRKRCTDFCVSRVRSLVCKVDILNSAVKHGRHVVVLGWAGLGWAGGASRSLLNPGVAAAVWLGEALRTLARPGTGH